MLINIIFGFVYFIEMTISYVFFSRVAEPKYSTSRSLIIGFLLFEPCILINFFFSNSIVLNSIFSILVHVAFCLICFKVKPLPATFYSVLLCIFATALEFATIFSVSSIIQTNIKSYTNDSMILIIESAISKILYFLICLMLSNFIVKDKSNVKFPVSLYIYPLAALFSLMTFWYISVQSTVTYHSRQLFAIVSIVLLGTTVLIFLSYQHNIKKENQYILLKSELEHLKTEKNYYDVLAHQNHQLMLYAHDAKNHLAAIKGLNKDPQIDEYIQKMSDTLSEYSNTCHSGNITLDVIVNRYVTECSIKKINFSFDVRLTNLEFIDDFDLVTILGNLLDNAIESAENSDNKFVFIETDYRNSYDVVIITNSCDKEPTVFNSKLITSKNDKNLHGLGISSVKNALKKYGGDINWEYIKDKRQFVTTVMLWHKK